MDNKGGISGSAFEYRKYILSALFSSSDSPPYSELLLSAHLIVFVLWEADNKNHCLQLSAGERGSKFRAVEQAGITGVPYVHMCKSGCCVTSSISIVYFTWRMYRNTQRNWCVSFQASILSFNCVYPYTRRKVIYPFVSQVTFRLFGKKILMAFVVFREWCNLGFYSVLLFLINSPSAKADFKKK